MDKPDDIDALLHGIIQEAKIKKNSKEIKTSSIEYLKILHDSILKYKKGFIVAKKNPDEYGFLFLGMTTKECLIMLEEIYSVILKKYHNEKPP